VNELKKLKKEDPETFNKKCKKYKHKRKAKIAFLVLVFIVIIVIILTKIHKLTE